MGVMANSKRLSRRPPSHRRFSTHERLALDLEHHRTWADTITEEEAGQANWKQTLSCGGFAAKLLAKHNRQLTSPPSSMRTDVSSYPTCSSTFDANLLPAADTSTTNLFARQRSIFRLCLVGTMPTSQSTYTSLSRCVPSQFCAFFSEQESHPII